MIADDAEAFLQEEMTRDGDAEAGKRLQKSLQEELFRGTRAIGEHAKSNLQGPGHKQASRISELELSVLPLTETGRENRGGISDGGFTAPGLAMDPPEGVESNVLAAGCITGMAAVQAGLGAAATVKACAEDAQAAATRAGGKDKKLSKALTDQAAKKKKNRRK